MLSTPLCCCSAWWGTTWPSGERVQGLGRRHYASAWEDILLGMLTNFQRTFSFTALEPSSWLARVANTTQQAWSPFCWACPTAGTRCRRLVPRWLSGCWSC